MKTIFQQARKFKPVMNVAGKLRSVTRPVRNENALIPRPKRHPEEHADGPDDFRDSGIATVPQP